MMDGLAVASVWILFLAIPFVVMALIVEIAKVVQEIKKRKVVRR